MFNTRLDYLICEYMVYCRSRQLRAKTMNSYEQGLRLFERWCQEQMGVDDANKITENIITSMKMITGFYLLYIAAPVSLSQGTPDG